MKLNSNISIFIISLFLAVSTLILYLPVKNFLFINYDDAAYIYNNPDVKSGLTLNGIVWAFTKFHSSNWHPLTWISHMIDCQIFKLDAGKHHLVNVIIHIINTILIFIIFSKMTDCAGKSFFIAALFAYHPLHIESVAWVAERKDLLSTFFGFLSLYMYFYYCKKSKRIWYFFSILFFLAGTLSKPMIVSYPLLFLLLDYWPLNRINFPLNQNYSKIIYLIKEKIPFFIITLCICIVTIFAQKNSIICLDKIPFEVRFFNAFVAYIQYIVKTIYPDNLSIIYLHPLKILWLESILSIITLIAIFWTVIKLMKTYPYIFVGWFWFIIMLIPVIGFVQVGKQAFANRYTYTSIIGLFIIITWVVSEKFKNIRLNYILLPLLSLITLIFFMRITRTELKYWKNTFTLFEHAIEVTKDNYEAYTVLGLEYMNIKKYDEAYRILSESLKINPDNASFLMAELLFKNNQFEKALSYYQRALKSKPENPDIYSKLSIIMYQLSDTDKAIEYAKSCLKYKPDFAEAHNNLGTYLLKKQNLAESKYHFLQAVNLTPSNIYYRLNLAHIYLDLGELDKSIAEYKKILELDPKSEEARQILSQIYKNSSH